MEVCKVCDFSGNDEQIFCNQCHESTIECGCSNEDPFSGITQGHHFFCETCGIKNDYENWLKTITNNDEQ